MVGNEDVGLVLFQMLTSLDSNRKQQGTDNHLTPPMARVIAPEMTIADGAANAHLQSRNDSKNNKKGRK